MITLAPMTGFAFASRTTPCSAAFLEADWPGRRCCETDCCDRSAPAPEPNAGTAQNKLRSNHRRADFEINTRDASRIASDPGCPVSSGEKHLESSGDHSFFRSRQVSLGGSARTIWVPIFALFTHDCTTDLQND